MPTPKPIDTKKLLEQIEAIINHPSPWTLKDRLQAYYDKIKAHAEL